MWSFFDDQNADNCYLEGGWRPVAIEGADLACDDAGEKAVTWVWKRVYVVEERAVSGCISSRGDVKGSVQAAWERRRNG